MKKIGIIGCGWLGKKIANSLIKEDKELFISNTNLDKATNLNSFAINFPSSRIIDYSKNYVHERLIFNRCDVIIISIPTNRKQSLKEISCTFENLSSFLHGNPSQQIFFLSSTGIYPSSEEPISESSILSKCMHKKFKHSEDLLSLAFPKINILRLSGLFGMDRIFSKYYSDKILQSGNQPVNHIHYNDVSQIISLMISQISMGKIYNLVAPIHPQKKQIIEEQLKKYQIKKPIAILSEPYDNKIISGDQLIKDLNYSFFHPNPVHF